MKKTKMVKNNYIKEGKNMSEVVSKKQVLKELMEFAKKKGKITLNDLNVKLDQIDISVSDIEKIYERLEKMGIEIVGVDEDNEDSEKMDYPDEIGRAHV